ncbi:hypothetical protein ABU178_00185 [Pantoea osteomyelitidis]|uniref:Uncharacterized protein n=1 Tax=Pantoea osteomyelitidis TaxID=3230026 RepID=A0ABW7PQW0_9GAMM
MGKLQTYRAVLTALASLGIAAGATFAAYQNILLLSRYSPDSPQPVPSAASEAASYTAIASLFNEARRSQAEVKAAVTPFDHRLLGISYSDNPLLSMVTLRKGNRQQSYHAGEKIDGHPDARIIHIAREQVDIASYGKIIHLAFKKRPESTPRLLPDATVKPRVLQDGGKLIPLYRENEIVSWRFLPASLNFSHERWRLGKDDIVLAVNDLDIMISQNSEQIERLWETATHAKVDILRDGKRITLEIDANK